MGSHANYRALSPEQTKAREEYTYAERRAELYDMLDRAGHYRNLEQSTRQLGDRYGVSHTTIRKDIQAILDWKADHLGENTEAELETLKTKAVQDALDEGDADKAYDIMSQHLENLQSLGIIEEEADELEVSGSIFNLPESVTDKWVRDGDE
jgi:hypothetical protein